jgi:hypothetical protein
MLKKRNHIIIQNSPLNRRIDKLSTQQESFQQLELFPLPLKRQKPQITSVPGTSIRERDRYRVVIEGAILGDRLTLDEAVNLAKHC